ncbi:MAG TPA: copper transporter [Actinomycetota bacterium]|nr:copper transporter [Actinomycetota bacterium]
MISFRYHVVSIVAVFLALALGVLLGTTVVNQGVIENLSQRTNDAVRRSEQLRSQVSELQTELRNWDRFGAEVEPMLISGQLTAREVVIVTQEGVDAAEIDGVRQALTDAGASVVAVIVVTNRMALLDDDARTDLQTIIGPLASGNDPIAMSETAARELAARLTNGPAGGTTDLLGELIDARFVVVRDGTGTIDQIGGATQALSILAGGNREPVLAPESFLAPLTVALAENARPVVAAETAETAYPFVPILRRDGSLDGGLVTVDNADTMPGRIAVVLGLRDLLQEPGRGGHFGVKGGASGLIPQP